MGKGSENEVVWLAVMAGAELVEFSTLWGWNFCIYILAFHPVRALKLSLTIFKPSHLLLKTMDESAFVYSV